MEETTVDARTRKLVGWVIAAIGAIIAILGAFAGPIGLGDDDFGGLQIAAVIIGRRRGRRRRGADALEPECRRATTTAGPSET